MIFDIWYLISDIQVMVIGFDGSRAFVTDRTGTENYSYYLLKNLAQIDTENGYLIYLRKGQKSKAKSQNWPANFKFVEIDWPRLWTQGGLALQTFKDKLDLLFVPAHTLPVFYKPGLKTVITVHDLGVEYLPFKHQLKQLLYLKFMTRYQLKSATRIIAVSKATKKDLTEKIGLPAEKIRVIYEGVDESLFKQSKSNIKNSTFNKFDIESNKYFLHIGTIQPRKNLERVIEAFNLFLDFNKRKENERFKLVLAGGKGWDSEDIFNLPKKLGISSQVIFTGRIEDNNLSGLYRQASGLIFPSLFEGFGLPILEAFACSCPVLTSNTSSMPEIAGDAAILVDPKSTKEIMEGMIKLSEDQSLRKKLIEKGQNRLKLFSWEKTAKETLELFEQTVNN